MHDELAVCTLRRPIGADHQRRLTIRYFYGAFGLVLAALGALLAGAASAQTAADVARQVWPHGAPAYTGTAPRAVTAIGGFDHGVQREVWLRDAPLVGGTAPKVRLAGSFTAADVAASLGHTATASRAQAPYLTANLSARLAKTKD